MGERGEERGKGNHPPKDFTSLKPSSDYVNHGGLWWRAEGVPDVPKQRARGSEKFFFFSVSHFATPTRRVEGEWWVTMKCWVGESMKNRRATVPKWKVGLLPQVATFQVATFDHCFTTISQLQKLRRCNPQYAQCQLSPSLFTWQSGLVASVDIQHM